VKPENFGFDAVYPTLDMPQRCFLAVSSRKGGFDGWRMIAIDPTGTDLWTVAGALEELKGFGGVVRGGVLNIFPESRR
jgi:hypothetical protein